MPNAGDFIRASHVMSQACRVARATLLGITSDSVTTVGFTSEIFDADGMHNTVTNNTRITIIVAGFYIVGFQGRFPAAADYMQTQAYLLLNGSTTIGLSQTPGTSFSTPQRVNVVTMYQFQAGDYIEAQVYQRNTAAAARNLEVISGQSPEFWAARVGS